MISPVLEMIISDASLAYNFQNIFLSGFRSAEKIRDLFQGNKKIYFLELNSNLKMGDIVQLVSNLESVDTLIILNLEGLPLSESEASSFFLNRELNLLRIANLKLDCSASVTHQMR